MPSRPNIVLILADDMGFSDIGCYGGPVETPHLDALARGGVRFTQFYNSARCCPARASLLTGLHPHQAGIGWMTAANLGRDPYVGDLNGRCATLAECLRPAGYATYMSGKWHLTYEAFTGPDGPKHSWPRQRGFDRFFGTTLGGGSYYRPRSLTEDNTQILPGEDFYYTDAIGDRACGFVRDHGAQKPSVPFFLYVAYTAPHWPLHARAGDIARYRGRFRAGWDALRREKHRRMLDMGLLDARWDLSARDAEVVPWDSLPPEKQDEYDLRMAIYAAQVHAMDRSVGRIVEALRATGALDDTLLLFLSDNGGCHEEIHRASPDPALFGTDASFESYGRPWANYSNVPFREFKSWVHEGGISTPLIAHWPRGLAVPGTITDQLGHITDIVPTALELAGAPYPPTGKPGLPPLVGQSLAPFLTSGRAQEHRPLFWEHEGNRAWRDGRWKLVAKSATGPWELYDMAADRSELRDLAAAMPERVAAMAAQWQAVAEAAGVLPLDGRGWSERVSDPRNVPPAVAGT